LQAGDVAPDVTVAIGDERVRLRDFVGRKRVVLYFYPKDSTPSCTIEAREFNGLLDDFTAAGTEVIGVSTDSAATHIHFARREGLRFSLATDADGTLAAAFGAANRLVQGIRARRVTFLIDTDGRIARVWDRVNPHTHPLDVLDAVRALPPGPSRNGKGSNAVPALWDEIVISTR
jgi:thioredoxin-dependent peroxiredoxin